MTINNNNRTNNNSTPGERLESLRRTMRMTQEEFGEELGLSGSTAGSYERNYRDLNDQARGVLVNKFGVRLDWLDKGEGKPFDDRTHLEEVIGMYIRLGEEGRQEVYKALVQAKER